MEFIKVVDVGFTYGRFPDDTNWKGLSLSKSWNKIDLGLMIMEDAKDGQFSDNVSLTLASIHTILPLLNEPAVCISIFPSSTQS